MEYNKLTKEQLLQEKNDLVISYESICDRNLSLDMSRGKPNSDQLDITAKIFSHIDCYTDRVFKDDFDLGNYGLFSGTMEAKEMFAELLDIKSNNVIVGGNSSLHLMYDMFAHLMLFGNQESDMPWCKEEKVKFICPSPGYDRHFAICEKMNIEMITVSIDEKGPDMDQIEKLKVSGVFLCIVIQMDIHINLKLLID
jgi:hypothetical protein